MKLNKIIFNCSTCNGELSVTDQEGGQHTVDTFCPTCGRRFCVNLYLTGGLIKIEVNNEGALYDTPQVRRTRGGRVFPITQTNKTSQ